MVQNVGTLYDYRSRSDVLVKLLLVNEIHISIEASCCTLDHIMFIRVNLLDLFN
jgi:hypothetical protein